MTTENQALAAKTRILQNLGGKNPADVLDILEQHFKHDGFRDNSMAIFKRCILAHHKGNPNDTLWDSFNTYATQEINSNFKKRAAKSLLSVPVYAVSTILALTGNLPAAIAVSAGATLASGVAESREKRNVAAIGHCQEHLAESSLKATVSLFNRQENYLTDDAKNAIKEILNIKNPDNIGSKIVRYLSYVSGPVVSGFKTIFSWAKDLSATGAFNVAFGIIAPIMPLLNTGASFCSAKLRHRSIRKQTAQFQAITEILFSPESYTNPDQINFTEMADDFKRTMSRPHCANTGKHTSCDETSNVKKGIGFANWLGNKIRKAIPAPDCLKTEDLTVEPEEFKAFYNQHCRAHIQRKRRNNYLYNMYMPYSLHNTQLFPCSASNNSIAHAIAEIFEKQWSRLHQDYDAQQEKLSSLKQDTKDFTLKSTSNIDGKTIMVWSDPNPKYANNPAYDITYIIDDTTEHVDVKYGSKAKAYIMLDSNKEDKIGARIYHINEGNIKDYGDKNNNSLNISFDYARTHTMYMNTGLEHLSRLMQPHPQYQPLLAASAA